MAERGAGLRDVLPDLAVMVALIGIMLVILARLISSQVKRIALLG